MQQAFKEVEKQQAAGNLTDDKPNLINSLLMSDDVTEQEVIMSMSEIFNGGTDTVRPLSLFSLFFPLIFNHPLQL